MEHRVHRYAKTFRQKLMDLTKMLSDLRTERSAIDQAILMPERMGAGKVVNVEDHRFGSLPSNDVRAHRGAITNRSRRITMVGQNV